MTTFFLNIVIVVLLIDEQKTTAMEVAMKIRTSYKHIVKWFFFLRLKNIPTQNLLKL